MKEALEMLKEKLAAQPEIRRTYLVEQRSGERPIDNPGILLAFEAPEATPQQWSNLLNIIEVCDVKTASEPIRLESASSLVREHVFRFGVVIDDKGDSPVSSNYEAV